MDYATAYDVGDRKRERGINEDSVAISVFQDGHRQGRTDQADGDAEDEGADDQPTDRSVATFALADGAGGDEAGDVASYIASTVVPERLADVAIRAARSDPDAFDVDLGDAAPDRPSAATLQGAIADAVRAAHRAVLGYVNESGQPAFTTIVAGIAVDGELHYGWVGDSRLYVCNDRHETIEQLTHDHSVVTELADAGEIDEVEAHVHPRGNEITNALGGHPGTDPTEATVEVETHTVPIYAEDVVFATSDGIIDAQTDAPSLHDRYVAAGRTDEVAETITEQVVTDADLRETILDADSLAAAGDRLLTLANDRGGKDNLSAILCQDPTLGPSPSSDRMPTRELYPDEPVEDRQTVILPDE
jgi:serine/threonine protein phosphatase PrpC